MVYFNGGFPWCECPGKSLLTDDQWLRTKEVLGLSNREYEVCRLLFIGKNRGEISEHLGVKLRTARHYVERLHDKLRVNSRVALVLRIVQVRDHLNLQP
ncbi:MAG: helix-turn-helix transcriptional regulator [Planctomycetota bacterium]